ncbi:MAG: putative membrane protein [Parcubacteria bacterium C7867-004]|nr:MAG: putative membrane protein [Parcubacteria bacterium C7867-004]
MDIKKGSSLYVRNIIFGIEDSLVSTVGLLSGIAVVNVPHRIILATGLILIFVEGVSMAIGSFLSEESVEEYESGMAAKVLQPMLGAFAMFLSYVIAGFIPLAPYLISTGDTAFYWSIGLSVLALAVVGFVQAKISKVPAFSRTVRMVLLGGFAIGIGILVGRLFGIT